jgi:hypothetical protein
VKRFVILLSIFFLVNSATATIQKGICISFAGGVSVPKRPPVFSKTWHYGPSFGVSIGTLQHWFWRVSVSGYFEYGRYTLNKDEYRTYYRIKPDSTPAGLADKLHRNMYNWGVMLKFSPLLDTNHGWDDQILFPFMLAGAGSSTLTKIDSRLHDDRLPHTSFTLFIGGGIDFVTSKHTAMFFEGKYYFWTEKKVESLNLHFGLRWDML